MLPSSTIRLLAWYKSVFLNRLNFRGKNKGQILEQTQTHSLLRDEKSTNFVSLQCRGKHISLKVSPENTSSKLFCRSPHQSGLHLPKCYNSARISDGKAVRKENSGKLCGSSPDISKQESNMFGQAAGLRNLC